MMKTMLRAAILLLVSCCAASAQKAFEVASIRVREGDPQWKFAISGSRLNIESYNLFGVIAEAYSLKNYQLVRSPELMAESTIYDIRAKAEGEGEPTRDEFRQMLQKLLTDRFQLKVHREMREMPVYALVVGKNGPKLKASDPSADPQGHTGASGDRYQFYQVSLPKGTIEQLSDQIAIAVSDRPIVNRTELTGTYDIKLSYTPDFKMTKGQESDSREVSIFTAVQDLGLRLEPRNEKIEVLVVDSVGIPSEN